MDQPTENRIALLHPSVRKEVIKIVKQGNKALTGNAKNRITQGFYSFDEQENNVLGCTKIRKPPLNPNGLYIF